MKKFNTTSSHQETASNSANTQQDISQSATAAAESTPVANLSTFRKTMGKKWFRRLCIGAAALVLIVLIAFGAFTIYASDYYHDVDVNHTNLVSTQQLPVEQSASYVAFGNPKANVGIVLYPGAKVEYTSYAPLMRALADRGYLAVVVEMPFNFAFFDVNAADRIRKTYPQVRQWWVGGHSLGGSMAAQYAASHTTDAGLAGVVLLGAYTVSDLSSSNLGVFSVYGSNDHVLNRQKIDESIALMPSDALLLELPGGNHAQFGHYGNQAGDGTANITAEKQVKRTADAIDEYISNRSGNARK